MRKIFQYRSHDGETPVECFINGLEPKTRKKIHTLMMTVAAGNDTLREPYVKAFRLERYKGLHEFRAKMVKLIRIIFYLTEEGDIVLLCAFIKKHDRATEYALDVSKGRVSEIRSGRADKIIYGGMQK